MNQVVVAPVAPVAPAVNMQTPPQSPRAPNPRILWAPVKDGNFQVHMNDENIRYIAMRGRIAFNTN